MVLKAWQDIAEGLEQPAPALFVKHSALSASDTSPFICAFIRELNDICCTEWYWDCVIRRMSLARKYSRVSITPLADYKLFRATLSSARRLKCSANKVGQLASMPDITYIK